MESSVVISSLGNTGNFVDADNPIGTVDGKNTQFVLWCVPNPPLSLRLYVNGLLNLAGTDYTLDGRQITFMQPPPAGTLLTAWYRY